jgi:hypothetical protein
MRTHVHVPSEEDAALIKGMLLRGDPQHHIAAWFGFNPGRIAEVKLGRRHPDVPAAPPEMLPPPGPYGRDKAA